MIMPLPQRLFYIHLLRLSSNFTCTITFALIPPPAPLSTRCPSSSSLSSPPHALPLDVADPLSSASCPPPLTPLLPTRLLTLVSVSCSAPANHPPPLPLLAPLQAARRHRNTLRPASKRGGGNMPTCAQWRVRWGLPTLTRKPGGAAIAGSTEIKVLMIKSSTMRRAERPLSHHRPPTCTACAPHARAKSLARAAHNPRDNPSARPDAHRSA